MKVEIENLNGNFKKLVVEVPADIVDTQIDKHLKTIQRDVALKGFRKGKAPLDLVRDVYAESEAPRITRQIVEESLNKAIVENAFSPVASPDVDVSPVKKGNPLKFTATFEHLPPVELKNYTGFKASKPAFETDATELADALKNIQRQMTRLAKADEGAALETNMVLQADYEAMEAGKKVDEASQENAFIEPGSGQLFAEFEDKVTGMKAGDEKSFTVKFPAKTPAGEAHPFAGRSFDFTVKAKTVFKKDAPALDDALAAKAGPFKTLSELETRLKGEIARQKEDQWKRETQEKIIEWLIEKNPLDAPETLVNQQIQNLAIEAGMQLQQMGLDQTAIEERLKEWGEEMTTRGVSQVKASLLLSAVARQEKIQVTDEDIRKEIGRMATQMRRDPQEIVKNLQDKNMIPGFMRQVQELKALEWILEKSV
jgi:trigger factor